jgi:hypothetical protein
MEPHLFYWGLGTQGKKKLQYEQTDLVRIILSRK